MTQRNKGIDLLRLVLMFMICILHILGQGGVLASCKVGTMQYDVFWLLEVVSYCAVDAFALISGYMAEDKPVLYKKIVDMWFQVFFYSCILTSLFIVFDFAKPLSVNEFIKTIFPVVNEEYWYFTAYFALFFLMPILNKALFPLNKANATKCLVMMFVLFSLLGFITGVDPFKTMRGYSTLWLIVLYCIGILSKKIDLLDNLETRTLIILWFGSILLTWFFKVFCGTKLFLAYTSPTILFAGLIMVVIFSRLNIRNGKVTRLSRLAFGIYLFQLNQVVWNFLLERLAFIASMDVFVGVFYVLAFSLILFILGIIVEYVRTQIYFLLKITKLSENLQNSKLFFLHCRHDQCNLLKMGFLFALQSFGAYSKELEKKFILH